MSGQRKSKRTHWEIMSQLEEAGEEDLCSLMNHVMGLQKHFGSGADLADYLNAIASLEEQGELQVRKYRLNEGKSIPGEIVVQDIADRSAGFRFDPLERLWRWNNEVRLSVELPDD